MAPIAQAGEPSIDIQQFKPVTDTHNFILIHDATLLPRLRPAAAIHFNFGLHPLEVNSQGLGLEGQGFGRQFGIVDGIVGGDITGAFGIFDWWEVGLHFPFMQVPITTPFVSSASIPQEEVPYGIGDIRIETRLRPLDGAKYPVGVVGNIFFTLPTGTWRAGLGRGLPGIGARAVVSQQWKRIHFAANLGFGIYPRASLANLTTEHEMTYGAGVGVSPIVDRLDINLEIDGSVTGGPNDKDGSERFFDMAHSPLELLLGVRYTFKNPNISIYGGIGRGLTGGFGATDLRAFVGVSWGIFEAIDRDKDGIRDPKDQCKSIPEDLDQFEDEDGCPEFDNDQDGILDTVDGCPNDPEDLDDFKDEDGCPELDNDEDGVVDTEDGCPLDPEDLDGFEDEDGCAELDNDQDAIPDDQDECPMVPESFDGWEDQDGCPDPDNDDDGILDDDDLCPNEPEEVNGVKDDDGCPDEILAVRSSERIVILDPVYFATNRRRILKKSDAVLDAVVEVLVENPDILTVRIEGHTDDVGRDDYNLRLSQRRAESVLRSLTERGIAADRLEAAGYGETRPVLNNSSEKARDANRRVEFRILVQGIRDDQMPDAEAIWGGDEKPDE